MWKICRTHRVDTGGPRHGHLCSSRYGYSRKKSPPKQQGFSLANVVPCRLFCGAPFLTDRASLELVKSSSLQGRVQSHGPGSNDALRLCVGAKQPSWRWGFARVVSASQASFLTLRHSGPWGWPRACSATSQHEWAVFRCWRDPHASLDSSPEGDTNAQADGSQPCHRQGCISLLICLFDDYRSAMGRDWFD